jgi:polysaccharide export outer membrane protein
MQNKPTNANKEVITVPTYIYKIAKGDILGIDISTFSKGNINSIGDNISKNTTSSADAMQNGYTVDANGNVNLPIVGLINVEGMTLEEAQETILKKTTEYINNPIIKVKILSFYITILGDVNRPGRIQVNTTSINLYEALALAGDLQLSANQQKIRIIRIVQGQATTYFVDMNSADVFKSEVFYLKPGDMIYVEPARVKVATQNLTALNVGTGILSTVFFIINIFIILKR